MELRYILEILWRRRWVALFIWVLMVGAIVVGTLMIPPRYDSTALILIRKSSASAAALNSIGLPDNSVTNSITGLTDTERANYVALASLRTIADKAIAELGLKQVRIRTGLMRAIPGLSTTLKMLGVNPGVAEKAMSAEDLLDFSLSSIVFPRPYVSVRQFEETDMIEIKGISPDPKQAMDIANTVARCFIQEEIKRIRNDFSQARIYIDANVIKAEKQYRAKLDAMKELKEKEQFFNLDSEAITLIERISGLKKSAADNQLTVSKTRSSLRNMENRLGGIPNFQKDSEEFKENETVVTLKTTLQNLYLSLAEMEMQYTKEHPLVISVEKKIVQAKKLIEQEALKTFGTETRSVNPLYQSLLQNIANTHADLAGLESIALSLPSLIEKYETQLMTLPQKAVEQARLTVGLTAAQDVYGTLVRYQHQVGMAESSALSGIRLVDPAVEPDKDSSKHKKPSLGVNILLAVCLGVMFGLGGALLIDYLDDTLRDRRDFEPFEEVPFLGAIPRFRENDLKCPDACGPEVLIPAIRKMAHRIRFFSSGKNLKTITLMSLMDGDGNSFLAVNLAVCLVRYGKKVLLIDANLDSPMLGRYFDLAPDMGLTRFIAGEADQTEIQLQTRMDGLKVILSGPALSNPGELFRSEKIKHLIRDMAAQYDWVIVDTPALNVSEDALVFASYTDGRIAVVRCGKVTRHQYADFLDGLRLADIPLTGVILNRVPRHSTDLQFL